jgi:hypothetical protein
MICIKAFICKQLISHTIQINQVVKMGLFGRKKKEAGVVEEAQDDNQLNLAYGNDDDDCSTEGDSLPPPPPGGGSTKQNVSLNDSHTVEDSPSADEANDVGVSMLSDPDSSMDEKNKDQDPSKRKVSLSS